MASRPVAWMAETIADGAAVVSSADARSALTGGGNRGPGKKERPLTRSLNRDQLLFQIGVHLCDAVELVQRARDVRHAALARHRHREERLVPGVSRVREALLGTAQSRTWNGVVIAVAMVAGCWLLVAGWLYSSE